MTSIDNQQTLLSDPSFPAALRSVAKTTASDLEAALDVLIEPHRTRGELSRGVIINNPDPTQALGCSIDYCIFRNIPWDAVNSNGRVDLRFVGVKPDAANSNPSYTVQILQDPIYGDRFGAGAAISITNGGQGEVEVVGANLVFGKGVWYINNQNVAEPARVKIVSSRIETQQWAIGGRNSAIEVNNVNIHVKDVQSRTLPYNRDTQTVSISEDNFVINVGQNTVFINDGMGFYLPSEPIDPNSVVYLFNVSHTMFSDFMKQSGGPLEAFKKILQLNLGLIVQAGDQPLGDIFTSRSIQDAVQRLPYDATKGYGNIAVVYDPKEKKIGVALVGGGDRKTNIPSTGTVVWAQKK
ncbi:hypothetical protein A2Z00_00585 [Candidatus Gottesmanbacteria bacterium RBG_13_45_10]|uniref:Uncharacterized protein n=1 Tax=Candidatus Gottesmanbacteria bacterium RBG_13_45_10 TaxID=1798370 RepID=A0A1F5ZG38_9BACT|nr:MAG: hypothetical protein A2Z00_00585 [Candidatus Gottesmanbacteria bacterium RBG_13_45_10]